MRSRIVYLLVALIVIVITIPAILGWLFQRHYKNQINFYNSFQQIHVEVKSYHRSWWTSKAIFVVHISTKNLRFDGEFPDNVDVTVEQTIKHGPIFFSQYFFPIEFGLAKVANTINVPVYGYPFSIVGVTTDGHIHKSANQLSINREVNIKELNFSSEKMGPLHLNMDAYQLNVKAVSDIVSAYHQFLSEGELYQGQLRSKLILLIPDMFDPGTNLVLNSLSLNAPNGRLTLQGKIAWPMENTGSPDDINDFFHNALFTLNFRISKTLLNEVIEFASTLPYMQNYSQEERQQLLALQDGVNAAFQQNNYLLERLMYFQLIPENEGNQLLVLGEDHASSDNYLATVKTLFLEKQIFPEIAYLLYFQFSQLQRQSDLFEQVLSQHQQEAKQELLFDIDDWIKQGYISRSMNDYVILVTRVHGETKFNGKILKDSDA